MERELPVINIEGTDFIVDVSKLELREMADPTNIIAFEICVMSEMVILLTTA